MMMRRWSIAAGLLLAGVTAACSDGSRAVGPDFDARLNTEEYTAPEEGPGGTIGSGHEQTTASTDTTGRGPGGTIGSGH